MSEYKFLDLSPFDFELLAKEIAEKHYRRDFEAFDVGRDGGIDIRSKVNKSVYIGQCKHYAKSTFAQLKNSLKNEIKKVKNQKPSKYIVFTSLRLTPANKRELVTELNELNLKEKDIWGSAAINSFLQKNPTIEKHHIKLWLNSTAVLESIIFKGITTRSNFYREDILKKARFWVDNSFLRKADLCLEKKHFCIISGIPGIGKTSLAEMICLEYAVSKFIFVKINSLEDFYDYYSPEEKQIFLYDDFLGETNFKDDKNFDDLKSILSHLNNNCKLVFTTREYIFKQAKKNEKFSILNLEKELLVIEKYTDFEKAKILYNHLFYGNVDREICNYIVKNKKYWEIINHKNYSPRIIDFMCNRNPKKEINDDKSFYENFIHNLEYPDDIWNRAFKNSVNTKGKYILYSLFFLGNGIDSEVLKEISYNWIKIQEPTLLESHYSIEYKSQLEELENSFIKIDSDGNNKYISFHNPSITDFFEHQISNKSPEVYEFNKLPHKYWDQKKVVFNYLTENDKYKILKNLCYTLSTSNIPRYQMNKNFTELEGKNFYLRRTLRENNFINLQSYINKRIINELFHRNQIEIHLLHNLVFTEKNIKLNLSKKWKLKKYFLNNDKIPVLKLMLEINEKYKFIKTKESTKHLTYISINDVGIVSYHELEEYQECYNYFIKQGNSIFQDALNDINNKLNILYEKIEDEIADAKYEEMMFEELQEKENEEIDNMFSSLIQEESL